MKSKLSLQINNINQEQLEKIFSELVTNKYLKLNEKVFPQPQNIQFTAQQFQKIKNDFLNICPDGEMDYNHFRATLGLLGSQDFFIRRVFNLIDTDHNQIISFEDFSKYLNIIFNGSNIEKALSGWKILAGDKSYFQMTDIWELFYEISMLWNALTGEIINPKKQYLEEIFNFFDSDQDQTITFQDYQIFFQEQPLIFGWFEFLNNYQIGQTDIKMGFSKGKAQLQEKRRSTINKISTIEENKFLRQHKSVLLKKKFIDVCKKLGQLAKTTKQQNFTVVKKFSKKQKETMSPLLDISFKSTHTFLRKPHQTPILLRQLTQQQRLQQQQYTQLISNQTKPKFYKNSVVVSQHDINSFLTTQLKSLLDKVSILQNACKELRQMQQNELKSIKRKKELNFKYQFVNKQLTNVNSESQNLNSNINEGKQKVIRNNLTVYFGHQNWNLVLNLMVGLRKSIKSLHTLNNKIQIKDTHFQEQYQFLLSNKLKIKDQEYFKFIDQCPLIFQKLRFNFGITNLDYQRSVGPESFISKLAMGNLTALSQKCSTGKSGSFFYQTHDDMYLLKTISKSEFMFFKNILKNYYTHMMENKNSLIVKICGLYKIKLFKHKKKINTIYFISMVNVFNVKLKILQRYDLKGSSYGRNGGQSELKDNDWINRKKKIKLDQYLRKQFINQIREDSQFLSKNNINDYSLLVGIAKNLQQQDQNSHQFFQKKNKSIFSDYYGGCLCAQQDQVYILSIIDILTQFGSGKNLEYLWKRTFIGEGVSCIPPPQYCNRFQNFVKEYIL